MSIAHPPSVFVSSTCYDLGQVRKDLQIFFQELGMVPVLSEFPSFPVNPNLDAVGNCLAGVKEKSDIFVLVVGERYGSKTESGKSVTNLEYMEAKGKGIPRYVFVHKPILTALSIWQKNKTGDFSGLVDSPKLFEFVESLRDPKEKNWVFHFESSQDIIETLRAQLAYLFMDSLMIRAKVLGAGLPDTLQDLSGAALSLAVQKPAFWEHKLFGRVLSDEISRLSSMRRDINYGLARGRSMRLGSPGEVIEWVKVKLGEQQMLLKSLDVLFNTAFPEAVGAPGEPGDVEKIVYVSRRMAEYYRRILEWTAEFRHIQVNDDFRRLMELTALMSHNIIEEIETFAANCNNQQIYEDAVRRHEESGQPQLVELKLTLTLPDMTELQAELDRLKIEFF